MSGTLQATVLKDGASATNNITLDGSGNATIGNNLTVTGTTTLTGAFTSAVTAPSFIPTGSTVPANGMYLSAANTLNLATNTTNQVSISSGGIVTGTAGNLMLVSGTAVSTTGTSFTGATSGASTTLTASSVTGTIAVGMMVTGTNIPATTYITAFGTGTGGAGTYTLSQASSGTVSGTVTVTGIGFLNIPSWVKRVTMNFNGVSTSGTSGLMVQLGSSAGYATGTYTGSATNGGGSVSTTAFTTGHGLNGGPLAANANYGSAVFNNVSGNIWVGSSTLGAAGTAQFAVGGSAVTIAATLDKIQFTTVNGTDTFDAGSINIQYE
jgi:hypothetical protein